MRFANTLPAAVMVAVGLLAGCATSAPTASPSAVPTSTPTAASSAPESRTTVAGTIVRFTAGSTHIDVTIDEDTPAARDFLARLPLTLSFSDFSHSEKIAYLPHSLDVQDTTGSSPRNGDFSYYKPWGNVIFYYDAPGGYTNDVVRLGTYRAAAEQLTALENGPVTIEVARA